MFLNVTTHESEEEFFADLLGLARGMSLSSYGIFIEILEKKLDTLCPFDSPYFSLA